MESVEKRDRIQTEGIVTSICKDKFLVEISEGVHILCSLSGRCRINGIRIILGDKVSIECSPYDLTKGRITFRHR
jgi:translation initiation factor IF-1